MPSERLITPGDGAAALADFYTKELGDCCKKALPVTLSNDEYLSRVSALIVALNRLLAEYVATSAHVHGRHIIELIDLTGQQFLRNIERAQSAIVGEGSTVQ
jgi:hypothetical protein